MPRKVQKYWYRIEVKKTGAWEEVPPRQLSIDLASVIVYKLSKKYGYIYGETIRVVRQPI